MSLLVEFAAPFVISALGSMPTGMITLTIVQKSISKGKQAAYLMAFGATIPEFIYTRIAIWCSTHLQLTENIRWYIELTAIFIFLGLAWFFYTKEEQFEDQQLTKKGARNNFSQGVIIASLNVLIIPFWVGILLWLKTYDMTVQGTRAIALFSLSSALGALVVFLAYAELGAYLVKRIAQIARIANRVIALVFLVLAIVFTVRLLW